MLNLTNQKFNRLTVLRPVGRTKDRLVIWECRCDCGKIKRVAGSHLRRGSTKSCGCFKEENLHKEGQAHHGWAGYQEMSKSFLTRMQDSAKLRGYKWDVSPKYLWELYLSQNRRCALSGRDIQMPIHVRTLRDKDNGTLASLDRIDSNFGYVKGNVQWVCKTINYMKWKLPTDVFVSLCKDVAQFKTLK